MFKKRNEAEGYIEKMIRSGDFKDCVHLGTLELDEYTSKPWEPYCRKDNFERRNRNQFPYCCPDPCDYFEDTTEAERTEQKAKRQESRREWWQGFGRIVLALPWQTQVLIVVSLFTIWALATHQLNTILEIVKAWRGSK
jgi:hypothetical protein